MNFVISLLDVIVILLLVEVCSSQPVSYRESLDDPIHLTTTQKKVKDQFQLRKQVMPIPRNDSLRKGIRPSENSKFNDGVPVTYRVKAVNLGDKTMRRQNDDDDDDDDGGEYEGATDYGQTKKEPQKPKLCGGDSVPMMIIREVDVMAMDIPMNQKKNQCQKIPKETQSKALEENPPDIADKDIGDDQKDTDVDDTLQDTTDEVDSCGNQKEQKDKDKDKEWGEWSPCSKSCGNGVQSRSRLRSSSSPEHDTQVRTCHLADCMPGDFRMAPPHFGMNRFAENRV